MPSNLIPPGLAYLAENIKSKDNILGAGKSKGAAWAKGLDLPHTADTIFFAGCGYQYSNDLESLMSLLRKIDKSPVNIDTAVGMAGLTKKLGIDAAGIFGKIVGRGNTEDQPLRDAIKVLSSLGINPGYLAEDEPCCGGVLYFGGMHKDFAEKARSVAQRLQAKGVKEIIGIVPSCTYTLKTLVPQFADGFKIPIKHFCEILAEKVPSLKLSYPQKVKVTYHDSCQLVRYLNLVEEPRKVLKSISNIEYVEPKWTSGTMSTCCGGGGGFEVVFPELSLTLAVNRAKELVETGAEIIVTHCPGCMMQIEAGLKEIKKDNIKVMDLSQIVAGAMGIKQ